MTEANPATNEPAATPIERPVDVSRRNLVMRALEFAAHGHVDLPPAFMAEATACLTGVLRDCEDRLLARVSELEGLLIWAGIPGRMVFSIDGGTFYAPLPPPAKDENGITRAHRKTVTDFMVWLYGEEPRSAAKHWVETGEWLGEDRMQLRLVAGMAKLMPSSSAEGPRKARQPASATRRRPMAPVSSTLAAMRARSAWVT